MMKRKIAAITAAVGVTVLLAGVGVANATTTPPPADPPAVATATPETVRVGEPSTITFTGGDDGIPLGFFASGATLTPSSVVLSGGTATSVFTADAPGEYEVRVTTESGATLLATTTVRVERAQQPVLTANPTRVMVGQPSAITLTGFDNPSSLETYIKRVGGGTGFEASLNPTRLANNNGVGTSTFTATEPGRYEVSVGNDGIAFATTTIEVVQRLTPTG